MYRKAITLSKFPNGSSESQIKNVGRVQWTVPIFFMALVKVVCEERADKLFLLAGTISLTVKRSGTEKVRQSAHGLPACGESIDWRDPFPNVEP